MVGVGWVYNEYSAYKPIRTALLCGGGTNICQKTHGLTFEAIYRRFFVDKNFLDQNVLESGHGPKDRQ